MRWLSTRRNITLLLLPALALYSLYFAYPIVFSIFQSFTDAKAFGSTTFVGATQYQEMAGDALFWSSLRNTGIILAIALLLLLPMAFGLALLLGRRMKGAGILRAAVFAPNVIAPILIGLIWIFILDPHLGLLNTVLRAIGIQEPPEWLGGTTLSPYSIGVVYVWQTVGFIMTILYAGLQMLPHDVMEAAAIDGATGWQKLRYVTIPMLRETIGISTVLIITGAFKVFELVLQLTGGGPIHLSETLVSYTYYVTFGIQKYGYGMALAVVVSIVGGVAGLGYLLLGRKKKEA